MIDDERKDNEMLFLALNNSELWQKKVKKKFIHHYELSDSQNFCRECELLCERIQARHNEGAKFLLQEGTVVKNTADDTNTSFYCAASCGDSKHVWIDFGDTALIDAQKIQNEALHVAITRGPENVVQLLLARGANPNAVVKKLLQQKSTNDLTETNNYLQTDNSDAKNEVEGNLTPLHLAVEVGRLKIVEMLLSHGAHVNAQTNRGSTPLLLAAKQNNTVICKALLKWGACVDTKDESGNSPLYCSIKAKNSYLVNYVLRYGPSIDDKVLELVLCEVTHDKITLHKTVNNLRSRHILHSMKGPEILALLRNKGSAVEFLTKIHCKAVMKQNSRDATLIQNGANINLPDLSGQIPLHQTVNEGRNTGTYITRLFLSGGTDFKLNATNGLTTLQLNFIHRNKTTVHKLLRLGEDVNCHADDGSTPLHLACIRGDKCIVDALLERGAKVNILQENGLAPLHIAALLGHADIIKTLLDHDADINARGASNETALHYGIMRKKHDVVTVLLENGCDVNIENNDGETALSLAIADAKRFPDSNDALQGPIVRQDVVTTLQNYMIKLRAIGFYVSEKNSRLLDGNPDLSDFRLRCEAEVCRMKLEKLHDNYALHDVFEKRRFPKHMANLAVALQLEYFDYEQYPIYKNWLVSTFKRSRNRIKLLTTGIESFVILLKTSNMQNGTKSLVLPLETLEDILSLLDKKDLENLIACGEDLRRQLKIKEQKKLDNVRISNVGQGLNWANFGRYTDLALWHLRYRGSR